MDVADEIMAQVRKCSMRHISFKPGAIEAIYTVCTIASRHPDINVILQWTGGRAGGHHSFEDMDAPICQTYATIRKHANIVLVAGSGFGDAAATIPYLTGEWAQAYNYPAMPYDGILMGSRCMVAKEAQGSDPCKQLIANAQGMASLPVLMPPVLRTMETVWVTNGPVSGAYLEATWTKKQVHADISTDACTQQESLGGH